MYNAKQSKNSATELQEQVQLEINQNKVQIDRSVFKKSEHERIELKRLKFQCTNCE